MAGEKLYGVVLQNQSLPCSSELVESLWVHNQSFEPSFQGSKSLVNVVHVSGLGVTDRPFFQAVEKEENNDDEEEDYEVCLHQPGKKRRLKREQVQLLESNFEVGNKLEPKRKVQLAKELGLQQRQVAIWFQNKRARFKTKQLEKDYTTMKASYDILKVDYDNLLQENDKLKEEVNSLKNRLVPREKEEQSLVDKSIHTVNLQYKMHMDLILNAAPEKGSKVSLPVMVISKQEDGNSAKSDMHDSDGNKSCIVEPADSSHVLEQDHSDFSQDEEDILSQNLLSVPFSPKIEDGCYDEPPECSCNFQFPVEDQTFCFWSY